MATTKSIDFENSPTVGGNDGTSAAWVMLGHFSRQNLITCDIIHCEEAGSSEEKCYFAYWPPNEKAEQFLCCGRKMFIRAAASPKLSRVRTAARSYLVNTSPEGLAGLGYKEDAVACRVFIQESQIVLLL